MLSHLLQQRFRAWWAFCAVFSSINLYAADYGVNLVRNSGAELTPIGQHGWKIGSGNWGTNNFEPAPSEGKQFFFAKKSDHTAYIYQDVDLTPFSATIDAGIQYFQITSLMAGWQAKDTTEQIFSFFNAEGAIVAWYRTGIYTSNQTWRSYNGIFKAPKGSIRLRITLRSFRHKGSDNDGYHDDVKAFALNPVDYQSNELLFNGSNVMGPSFGWVSEAGAWDRRNSDPIGKDGGNYFYCKNPYGSLYQDVDVSAFAESIDEGIKEFRYVGYQAGWNGIDSSEVTLYYMSAPDAQGKTQVLATYTTGRVYSSKQWIKRENTKIAPPGTRTIRVRLRAWRKNQWFNNNNDGYIDAMSLVHLPTDRDGDGLPNVKEVAWGLNPDDPADGALDLDGDGFSNQQEYAAGTGVNRAEDFPALNIKAFTADKALVAEKGESVTIGWEIFGATSAKLFVGETLLEEYASSSHELWNGHATVTPQATTVYQLHVSDGQKTLKSDLVVPFIPIQKVTEWPAVLSESHPYILDSLTLMSDGSHSVSLIDGSYAYFTQFSDNKTLTWQKNNLGQVQHKALLVNGDIVVGTDAVSQTQGQIVALTKTGEVRWSFTTDSPVKAQPVADSSGKQIFVVDYYGKVYSLDAISGMLLWVYQLPAEDIVVVSAPALKAVMNASNTLDVEQSRLLIRTTSNQLYAIKLVEVGDRLIWVKEI